MAAQSWAVGLRLVALLGLFSIGLAIQLPVSSTFGNFRHGANVKSRSYLSEPFILGPGEVTNKQYDMEFPAGHIAMKGFNAEIVDQDGISVSLTDVYLHHWLVERQYTDEAGTNTRIRNDGFCQDHILDHLIGVGSETRHTNYNIPGPYGIVVGDPALVPEGSRETWLLTVHAIDTRATVDPMGCLECSCKAYGTDASRHEDAVGPDYLGGVLCCVNGDQCLVEEGPLPGKKKYHLKYTVHWVDWDTSVVPVRTYIMDVTANGEREQEENSIGCKVEYTVPACDTSLPSASCVHNLETVFRLPKGGKVVSMIGHQHIGGTGCTLYGEDGRELCISEPLYGTGTAVGDEAGYVVGMGSCIPESGSVVEVYDGEKLRLQGRYSSLVQHTGAMTLFALIVADFDESEAAIMPLGTSLSVAMVPPNALGAVTVFLGLAGVVAACGVIVVGLVLVRRRTRVDSYERLP